MQVLNILVTSVTIRPRHREVLRISISFYTNTTVWNILETSVNIRQDGKNISKNANQQDTGCLGKSISKISTVIMMWVKAQPQLNSIQLKLRLRWSIFPLNPATHPPSRNLLNFEPQLNSSKFKSTQIEVEMVNSTSTQTKADVSLNSTFPASHPPSHPATHQPGII